MKKLDRLNIRLDEAEKTNIFWLAEQYDTNPSDLIRSVMKRLVAAKKKHKKQLVWPPEFNYHADAKTVQDEQDKRDALHKAG